MRITYLVVFVAIMLALSCAGPTQTPVPTETSPAPVVIESDPCIGIYAHEWGVTSVSFSLDGKLLASGSLDNTIKLWDIASGVCLKTLEGHTGDVTSVSFSPDGKLLASGSLDNTIKLWNAASGVCLRTFAEHMATVTSVSFSPDGKLLASGSLDKTIKLWDAVSGVCLKTLEGHKSIVDLVSFSPDGKLLASGGRDKTIKLWDAVSGACLKTLEGHTANIFAVSFSPDGKLLASGSLDNTIKLWDIASGVCLKTLEGHTGDVTSVSFSSDGKLLASGSWDDTIKLWDAVSGVCLKILEGHIDCVTSVSFSPDGKLLASGSLDKTIKLWDAINFKESLTTCLYDPAITAKKTPSAPPPPTPVATPTVQELIERIEGLEKEELAYRSEGIGRWVPMVQKGAFIPSVQMYATWSEQLRYSSVPSPVKDYINSNKELQTAKKLGDVCNKLVEALQLDESNAEVNLWLGYFGPAVGMPPELALLYLTDAIEKDMTSQQTTAMLAYMQRGIFQLYLGEDIEGAITDLGHCLRLGANKREVVPTLFQIVYLNRGVAFNNLESSPGEDNTLNALRDYKEALRLAHAEPVPAVVESIAEIVREFEKANPR